MENVVLIVHLILALGLIAVVLLQRSEGGGLGMGGGGGGAVSGRSAATAPPPPPNHHRGRKIRRLLGYRPSGRHATSSEPR